MKIFNTMTRQKEEFVPLEEGKVSMYVCRVQSDSHWQCASDDRL